MIFKAGVNYNYFFKSVLLNRKDEVYTMDHLIAIMILLIFIFVWFYPVLKRHRQMEGYADKKAKLKALLFGLVPATVVLFSCQFVLGWLIKLAGISDKGILICFLRGYIMYALIEELTKFGFAYLVLKKFEKLKKIDIMLIFGLVGMGYSMRAYMRKRMVMMQVPKRIRFFRW